MTARRIVLFLSLFLAPTVADAGQSWITDKPEWTTPSGRVIYTMVDLPRDQHVKNIAAPRGGLGNCVWASMDMGARWANCLALIGIINKVEYGGGYPQKVTKIVQQFGKGVEVAQYEGNDLAFVELALRTNRLPCTTFGYSSRYGGAASIQHMVVTVYLDSEYACVIDDNFPGTWEWMTRAEYEWRFRHPNAQGWAYVLLWPPPPPIPTNHASLEEPRRVQPPQYAIATASRRRHVRARHRPHGDPRGRRDGRAVDHRSPIGAEHGAVLPVRHQLPVSAECVPVTTSARTR